MKMLATILLSATLAAGCRGSNVPAQAPAQKGSKAVTTKSQAAVRSGHVPVNGVDYYYEIRGQGEPLLLLHGGLGSIEMFGPVLDQLAETRQVIGVDLQGHGRTSLGERPMDVPEMGDDMAAILDKLGYRQVDVMGYSLGAAVAFRLAVQHPASVRRLVLASVALTQDAFYPELLPLQAQVTAAAAPYMKDTPMYQSYVKIAPHPEDFPKLLDRIGELMRKKYDWKADVAKVQAPTMLVWGDSDMMRPEHMIEAYKLFGGGKQDAGWQREHMSKNRLAILPNVTHYEMFMAPQLVPTVLPFLDGKTAAPSWSAQVASH